MTKLNRLIASSLGFVKSRKRKFKNSKVEFRGDRAADLLSRAAALDERLADL